MEKEKKSTDTCIRCLYREMSDSAYYQYIKNYLEGMDPDDKVSEAEYEMRLNDCKACSYFQNGMCRHCGCFVEIRCASRHRRCPDPIPKW